MNTPLTKRKRIDTDLPESDSSSCRRVHPYIEDSLASPVPSSGLCPPTSDSPISVVPSADRYPEYLAHLFVAEKEQVDRTNTRCTPIIAPAIRDIVVSWLMELKRTFRMSLGTITLAMHYFDRTYPDLRETVELEAVLAGCLMLAYKFYEPDVLATRVNTECIAECCDGAVTPALIKQQELAIVKLLDWKLNIITFYNFAETILGMSMQGLMVCEGQSPQLYEYLCEIFCHIALKDDHMMRQLPSLVGWSCVLATLRTAFKIQSGEETGESDYQGVLASVPLHAEKQIILNNTIESLCRQFEGVYGTPLIPKFEEMGSPKGVIEAAGRQRL